VNQTKVIPTIFSKNIFEFKTQFEKVSSLSKLLHIDIMDGEFVPSSSVSLDTLLWLSNEKNDFEVHLMCTTPENYFNSCEKIGVKKVFVHIEVFSSILDCKAFLEKYASMPFEIGLAIHPKTSLELLFNLLKLLNTNISILLMSVIPGAQGQTFLEDTYEKIKTITQSFPEILIQVDGGVKEHETKQLSSLGIFGVCVGSFINQAEFPKKNYELLLEKTLK
jgi:ribulose-phosphate 3-epimerase